MQAGVETLHGEGGGGGESDVQTLLKEYIMILWNHPPNQFLFNYQG